MPIIGQLALADKASGGAVSGAVDDLTGKTAEDAANEAARLQAAGVASGISETRAAADRGLSFLEPFGSLGQSGVDQAGFLTDPQAQFDFLQNNPLFKLGLDNLNTQTQQSAASRGRLSAGDTLQQLTSNALLAASPLISQQKQSIGDLLNFGAGVAGGQANISIGEGANVTDLITSGASAEAAGRVGAANAAGAGTQNILSTALLAGGLFSDKRLKSNVVKLGTHKGFNIYSWTWNKLAETLGLNGSSYGVLAQEVQKIEPNAVNNRNGYLTVNYKMLGVKHGR